MTLGEYLALIPSFHALQPRYMNTLAALLRPLVDSQTMLAKLREDFDLDTAVGVQLDMVGRWIGRDRYLRMPITGVFFAFDTMFVGFDQGVWEGIWDATTQITALDDETYRTLLKLQALANHWDSTIPSVAEAFNALFPGVVIIDRGDFHHQTMTMEVVIPGIHMSALLEAVLVQDFMLKPSGVHVNIFKSTVLDEPVFAFDTDDRVLGGFDHGAWAELIYSA